MIITPRIQSAPLNDNYTEDTVSPLNDNYTEDTVSLA